MPFQVETAAFCPNRGRFAAGGSDMWPRLFDANTGDELGALVSEAQMHSEKRLEHRFTVLSCHRCRWKGGVAAA